MIKNESTPTPPPPSRPLFLSPPFSFPLSPLLRHSPPSLWRGQTHFKTHAATGVRTNFVTVNGFLHLIRTPLPFFPLPLPLFLSLIAMRDEGRLEDELSFGSYLPTPSTQAHVMALTYSTSNSPKKTLFFFPPFPLLSPPRVPSGNT